MTRSLASRLEDRDDALCDEAAEEINRIETEIDILKSRLDALEDEAADLRRKNADLEGARLCSPCSFGTVATEPLFCVACGGRR